MASTKQTALKQLKQPYKLAAGTNKSPRNNDKWMNNLTTDADSPLWNTVLKYMNFSFIVLFSSSVFYPKIDISLSKDYKGT